MKQYEVELYSNGLGFFECSTFKVIVTCEILIRDRRNERLISADGFAYEFQHDIVNIGIKTK
jgi:hypothetical protein